MLSTRHFGRALGLASPRKGYARAGEAGGMRCCFSFGPLDGLLWAYVVDRSPLYVCVNRIAHFYASDENF